MWTLLKLINPRAWFACALAALLLFATFSVYRMGAASVQVKWDADTALRASVTATALAARQGEFRKTEILLNNSAAETRKATNDQDLIRNTQRDVLLKRVRVAEANAATNTLVSQVTTVTGAGPAPTGGDGPDLLGSLGSADVEEANRADTIRLHLKGCYADYNRAKEALSQ